MVINNLNKSETKILLDTEDLKNAGISINDWIVSPIQNLNKLFINFSEYKNIDIKQFNIYSFKFILFYIVITYT